MFEQILSTNLINFLIVISTLVLIFKKAHLGNLIDKMADDIKNSVEKSALDAKNAISEYKEIKKSTKDTTRIQEEIINQARINAKNIEEKIDKTTQKQKQDILSNLEKLKKSQTDKTKTNTTNSIYQSCIDLALEETKNLLDYNMHRKLINTSINELDKIEGGLV